MVKRVDLNLDVWSEKSFFTVRYDVSNYNACLLQFKACINHHFSANPCCVSVNRIFQNTRIF